MSYEDLIRLEFQQVLVRLSFHGVTDEDHEAIVKIFSEVFPKPAPKLAELPRPLTVAERIREHTELSLSEDGEITLAVSFSEGYTMVVRLDEIPLFVNGLTAILTKQVSLDQLRELPDGNMLRVIGESLKQADGCVFFNDHHGLPHMIPSRELAKALVAMTQAYQQVASHRSYYTEQLRGEHA